MIKRRFISLAKTIEEAGRFDLGTFGSFINHDIVDWDLLDDDYSVEHDATVIIHNCNTSGCVCGWINAIAGRKHADDTGFASAWLGLNEEDSDQLFYDEGGLWDGFDKQSADDAGQLLRAIVAGTVHFKELTDDGWVERL